MIKHLRALWVVSCIVLNTLLLGTPALCIGLCQYLHPCIKKAIWPILNGFYHAWVDGNTFLLKTFLPTTWHITGDSTSLKPSEDYLIIANHQTWADILVIQGVLNRKVPHIYFVLKASLRWIPIAGLMCKLFGYPFIQRTSMAKMRQNPKARLQNQQNIQQACQGFAAHPSALLTFVEGTRYHPTKAKHSPYHHLLPPHSAGLGHALDAWPKHTPKLLNLTVAFKHPRPSLWAWLKGEISSIHVHIEVTSIPKHIQPYAKNKTTFLSWLKTLWTAKDETLKKNLKNNI